jgi:hypothetical protein
MENLARYIIRASFSQERMQYLDQGGIGLLLRSSSVSPRCSLTWIRAKAY